jgi:hypothetical protein
LQQIALRQISDEILAQYELVILVRGEHFSDAADNPQLYGSLKRYVENGGSLLMTSWVAWELKASPAFGGELPFIFSGKFKEDVEIEARVTDHELAAAIFEPNIRYTAPLEYGLAHHQAAVLLETTNGDPLFAFRRVEKGTQAGFYYYLNCCQHSCRQPDIASPLSTSPQLHRSMERLLAWIWSRGY